MNLFMLMVKVKEVYLTLTKPEHACLFFGTKEVPVSYLAVGVDVLEGVLLRRDAGEAVVGELVGCDDDEGSDEEG
jgi:hypothetical protein